MAHFQGFLTTILLLSLYLLHTLLPAVADPPYQLCPSISNYTEDSPFQKNLNNLLQTLSSNSYTSMFYNTTCGNDPDKVYGLYMCLNYVANETCNKCITTASQSIIALCPNIKEALVYEEVCQLRYSDGNFFGQLDVSNNTGQNNPLNISEPEMFKSLVNKTLHNLREMAVFNLTANMYAIGEVPYRNRTIFAIVQCTRDLSAGDCNKCLEKAIEDVLDKYYFYRGARMFSRSCFLRYELYEFYVASQAHDRKGEDRGEMWKTAILASVLALVAMVLLGSCVYFYAVNKRKQRREDEILGQPVFHNQTFQTRNVDRKGQELPYIDLASIDAATNNFSYSNKLGEGGFGPVYKGILSDGREVAVKRLSSCSEQGSVEFTNEVHLIMRLQHKNLVLLLGFCVDGEEKILVYEYMPNSSLDVILFDARKRAKLGWSKRVDIINGIARGTLYLHEDSRLRIIHRDLKASNILLDCDMNPKISDFGMARIFAGSEGQTNTSTIVGTYGYMAPEYAMEGLYSVKSDVYSYGVLLLEIITGRRNGGFLQIQNAPGLLGYAWQLWNEGRGLELIDPLLMVDSYEADKFLSYLHIGLLCVQEDAYDRPNMSGVVLMLKSESTTLCQPKRPAFFRERFVEKSGVNNDDSSSANGLTVSNVQPR